MSLILVEDQVDSFGDLIVSCWNDSSRMSLFASNSATLDECSSLAIRAFEGQYGKRPDWVSIHRVEMLVSSQSLGIKLD